MGTAKLQMRFTIISRQLPARSHLNGSTSFQISGMILVCLETGGDETGSFFVALQVSPEV
jgi:hypothetical protein